MTGPTFATAATTPAPAAPPRAPKPAARPGQPPDDGAGMRVLVYLRLHWLMIVFCGTLLGGAGAMAAWELLASKYESYAMLQVSSAPTTLANQNNPQQARTDFVTELKTTSALIKSEFVLNSALRDIKDLPTIKAQKDPIKYLDEELMVTWQDGSEVIRITFKGSEPEDARKIVDAVQKAFMREVVENKVKDLHKFMAKVEDARLKVKDALDKRFVTPPGAVKTVGGTTPDATGVPRPLPTTPGGAPDRLPAEMLLLLDPSSLVKEVIALKAELNELPLTIAHHKRRESVLKERMEFIRTAPVPKDVEARIEVDPEVIAATQRMMKSHQEWQIRYKNSMNPETAPGVLDLKRAYEADKARWETVKAEKQKALEEARRTAEALKIQPELQNTVATIQLFEERYETKKKALAAAEKQLLTLPLPEKGVLTASGRFEPRRPEYRPDDSQQDVMDGVFRRLELQHNLLKLEIDSPDRVKVLQPASHPTQKDAKKQIMGTAVAGLMGFLLMAAGVIGYETVCRRVSSLADVKTATPAPVVGVIPYPPGADRDPVRRAAAGEAVDKLRAYVSQTWLARGATTIAVTSPIGDEGKAFAAFGLASSLAQSGYKTLVVDFDLREPALHTLANVSNGAGVCELLRAETDMRDAVQFLPSGLHLLPAGKWSDEARKAATGEKLEAVLAKLKEPYDCVVIHGHALLTVAESVEVARRCEVVLVCAKYRETATPLLKRAAERVATMEIPYSGVVYVGATDGEALC